MASTQQHQPPSPAFDALAQVACPACFGNLQLADSRLVCAGCCRAYPIIDGIPVLIVERAVNTSRSE